MNCEIEQALLLQKLQQVGAAVSDRDLLPILTFVNIDKGYLNGYDGRHAMRIQVPQLEGITANVKYDKLLKAVQAGEGQIKLQMKGNRLYVSSGRFRAQLSVTPELFPYMLDEGKETRWEAMEDESLIDTLRILLPFVSTNMSRPWQTGVFLDGKYAYATDNMAIGRIPFTWPLSPITIPRDICQELISLNVSVGCVGQVKGRTLFDCDAFVMDVQCFSESFPATIGKMVDEAEGRGINEAIPEGLSDAIKRVSSFVGDDKFPSVHFGKDGVFTEGAEDKAQVIGFELPACVFNPRLILSVLDCATHINLSEFPRCAFRGKRIVGVVAGMRS